jgi:hypothetical protein
MDLVHAHAGRTELTTFLPKPRVEAERLGSPYYGSARFTCEESIEQVANRSLVIGQSQVETHQKLL